MKKRLWVLLAAFALVPMFALAAEFRSGEQPSLNAQETVAGDLYMGGGNVSSSGAVAGDLLAAGGNVLSSARVGGDIALAGGSVTLLGTVADDARIAGGNLTVSAAVQGDLLALGGQVNVSGAGIGGDAVVFGGTVRIDAPVAGDAKLGGGDVYLNAPISGNVEINADRVTIGSAAVITGTLSYTSPKEATVEQGAKLGTVTYTPREKRADGKAAAAALISIWLIAKLLMLLACAFLFGLLLRRFATDVVDDAYAQPLTEIGRGFITLIVLPVASIFLLITVIGLPLGGLGLIAYAGLLLLGYILSPILLGALLGRWVFRYEEYVVSWQTILLGVVAIFILGLIPLVGWIIIFGFRLLALGVLAKMLWSTVQGWR